MACNPATPAPITRTRPGALRENLRALRSVFGVRITGFHSRPRLHDNLESRFDKIRDHRRHQRDTPLPRETLFRDTDNHGPSSDPNSHRLPATPLRSEGL